MRIAYDRLCEWAQVALDEPVAEHPDDRVARTMWLHDRIRAAIGSTPSLAYIRQTSDPVWDTIETDGLAALTLRNPKATASRAERDTARGHPPLPPEPCGTRAGMARHETTPAIWGPVDDCTACLDYRSTRNAARYRARKLRGNP
jgi:hypothetical protein